MVARPKVFGLVWLQDPRCLDWHGSRSKVLGICVVSDSRRLDLKLLSDPSILGLVQLPDPSILGLALRICIIFLSQVKVIVLLRTKILMQKCWIISGYLTNNSLYTSNVLLTKKPESRVWVWQSCQTDALGPDMT